MTDEDYQEHLEKIALKGERLAMMTKFLGRHMKKIFVMVITMTVGGLLWFLWGYFSKLRSKD